jgi:hypothetical protein
MCFGEPVSVLGDMGHWALGNWNWIRHTRVGGVFATPRLHGMYRRIIKWADIFQNYFHNFSTTLI